MKKGKVSRKRYPGRGILANRIIYEIIDESCKCLNCRTYIVASDHAWVVRDRRNRVRAKFCSHDCQQTYEYNYLVSRGFFQ